MPDGAVVSAFKADGVVVSAFKASPSLAVVSRQNESLVPKWFMV